jgi:DNA-binding transcriptional LysR family regulator
VELYQRAAERLHVSQPAITAHLKALEDELSVLLFEHTRARMVLTSAGKLLLGEADKALNQLQEIKHLALRMRDSVAGRVRLGTIIDPEFPRLGPFLKRLTESYPVIETETRHGISGWVFASVLDREMAAAGLERIGLLAPLKSTIGSSDMLFSTAGCVVRIGRSASFDRASQRP